jgi:hypothetical protein
MWLSSASAAAFFVFARTCGLGAAAGASWRVRVEASHCWHREMTLGKAMEAASCPGLGRVVGVVGWGICCSR